MLYSSLSSVSLCCEWLDISGTAGVQGLQGAGEEIWSPHLYDEFTQPVYCPFGEEVPVQGLCPVPSGRGKKTNLTSAALYKIYKKGLRIFFGLFFFFFFLSEQVVTEPPKSQSNVHLNYSSETNQMTNDVQRDQSALPLEQAQTGGGPFHPPTTTNSPTDPSFFSFPVTKTPGRSICKLVSKKV